MVKRTQIVSGSAGIFTQVCILLRGDGGRVTRKGQDRRLTRKQFALVNTRHFLSKLNLLTDLQCPDEEIYPASPALEAVEEFPECVLVPQA